MVITLIKLSIVNLKKHSDAYASSHYSILRSFQHAHRTQLFPSKPGDSWPQYVPPQLCSKLHLHPGQVTYGDCFHQILFWCFRTWHLGPVLCTLTNFMSFYTVATSVFFLMALTAERSIFYYCHTPVQVQTSVFGLGVDFVLPLSQQEQEEQTPPKSIRSLKSDT